MAYSNTVDERYGGTFTSSFAGARDAPYNLGTPYTIAQGFFNVAYGALIPNGFIADKDLFSLGILSPGKYSVTAMGWNWDFSNSTYGLGLSNVVIYDNAGYVVASSYFGTINITVNAAGTYFVGVEGSTYTSTEYEIYYDYVGPATPPNYPALISGGLAGSVQVGGALTMNVSISDLNGTTAVSATGPIYFWETSADGVKWSPVANVTTKSVTIGSNDLGKYIRCTITFFDDNGYLESYTSTATNRIAPAPDTVAPVIVAQNPTDEAANVGLDANIVLKFSEAVFRGTGSIVVREFGGGVVESFNSSTSERIAIVNDIVSIDLTSNLAAGKRYSVDLSPGALKDSAGNAFGGLTGYNFTTVPPTNRAPTASDTSIQTSEDVVAVGQLPAATDPDQDPIAYSITSQSKYGTVQTTASGKYTYMPTGNFAGADSFKYKVSDGKGGESTHTVVVTVTPVNDAPIAQTLTIAATEDAALTGKVSVTDVDSAGVTTSVVDAPKHGVLSLRDDGSFIYTPAPNFSGDDSFSYRATDGTAQSQAAVVSITVKGVADQFLGTSAADSLQGHADGDTYLLGAGDDRVTPAGGNDTIDGGPGVDVVAFSSARTNFTIARSGSTWTVSDKTRAEGTDVLENVERLAFPDTYVALDTGTFQAAGQVAQIIRAILGTQYLAIKEYVGVGLSLLDTGTTYTDLVSLAIATPIFESLAGSRSNADFVKTVYRNVVGHAPDQASLAELVGLLDTGVYSQTSLGVVACQFQLNTASTDLVGIAETGIAFVPL